MRDRPACNPDQRKLVRGREVVLEIVEVLFVLDFDHEFAGKSPQLPGPGVGGDGNEQLLGCGCHGCGMLQNEGTGKPAESACDTFDGNVDGAAGFRIARRKHLALARGFQIAMELLANRETCDRSGGFEIGRRLGNDFDVEGADGMRRHGAFFLRVASGGTQGRENDREEPKQNTLFRPR